MAADVVHNAISFDGLVNVVELVDVRHRKDIYRP